MTTSSFSRLATVTASTKRSPAAVAGKIGAMQTNLASISIVPLMPIDPEISSTVALNSPREAKQTFVDGSEDVVEGDRLVVSGTEYVIRSVAEWPGDEACLHIVVEELK